MYDEKSLNEQAELLRDENLSRGNFVYWGISSDDYRVYLAKPHETFGTNPDSQIRPIEVSELPLQKDKNHIDYVIIPEPGTTLGQTEALIAALAIRGGWERGGGSFSWMIRLSEGMNVHRDIKELLFAAHDNPERDFSLERIEYFSGGYSDYIFRDIEDRSRLIPPLTFYVAGDNFTPGDRLRLASIAEFNGFSLYFISEENLFRQHAESPGGLDVQYEFINLLNDSHGNDYGRLQVANIQIADEGDRYVLGGVIKRFFVSDNNLLSGIRNLYIPPYLMMRGSKLFRFRYPGAPETLDETVMEHEIKAWTFFQNFLGIHLNEPMRFPLANLLQEMQFDYWAAAVMSPNHDQGENLTDIEIAVDHPDRTNAKHLADINEKFYMLMATQNGHLPPLDLDFIETIFMSPPLIEVRDRAITSAVIHIIDKLVGTAYYGARVDWGKELSFTTGNQEADLERFKVLFTRFLYPEEYREVRAQADALKVMSLPSYAVLFGNISVYKPEEILEAARRAGIEYSPAALREFETMRKRLGQSLVDFNDVVHRFNVKNAGVEYMVELVAHNLARAYMKNIFGTGVYALPLYFAFMADVNHRMGNLLHSEPK